MRAIFHVGHPKTGSTALQGALAASRAPLIERGVLFPTNPYGRFNNHRMIFADIYQPKEVPRVVRKDFALAEIPAIRDGAIASINAEIEAHRPECLVLSSEQRFRAWSGEQRRRLLDALGELGAREAEIVAYVRRPSGWYLSQLQQQLKASHKVKRPGSLRSFPPVEQLAEDHGRDRVHLRPYDRRALANGDISADFVERFLAQHGVVVGDLERTSESNVSLAAEAFDLVRQYRLRFHPDQNEKFLPESRGLMAALTRIQQEVGLPRPKLDPDWAERIDYCSDDLLRLRDAFGLELPDYDYARLERGDLTTVPAEAPELADLVMIDREAQAAAVAKLLETPWATGAAERLSWLREIAGMPDPAAAAAAAPKAQAKPRAWTDRVAEPGQTVLALGGAFARRGMHALREAGFEAVRGGVAGGAPTATSIARWLEWAATETPPGGTLAGAEGQVIDLLSPRSKDDPFASEAEALAARGTAIERLRGAGRRARIALIDVESARAHVTSDGQEIPDGTLAETTARAQGVDEIAEALGHAVSRLRQINPEIRIVLCVSAVVPGGMPEDWHARAEAGEEAAALRSAVARIVHETEGVEYFPAFELLNGRIDPAGQPLARARKAALAQAASVLAAGLSGHALADAALSDAAAG